MKNVKLLIISIIIFLLVLNIIVSSDFETKAKKAPKNKDNKKNEHKNLNYSNGHGKVKFLDLVNSSYGSDELADAIVISQNTISIDTENYKELNVPGNLTFENITLINPIILRNGIWCQECFLITYGNNSYDAKVPGFSTWTLVTTIFNGTFNQTNLIYSNLSKKNDASLIFLFEQNISSNNPVNKLTDFSVNGLTGYVRDTNTSNNDLQNIGPVWNDTGGPFPNTGYFNFDGIDDIIEVLPSTTFQPAQNITYNVWVKHSTVVANVAIIGDLNTSTANGCQIRGRGDSNGISFQCRINGIFYAINGQVQNINSNTWRMLSLVYNGTGLTGYIDGVYQVSNYTTGSITYTDTNFTLGLSTNYIQSQAFNGSMALPQVFSRGLTAQEILNLNNSGILSNYTWKYFPNGNYKTILHNASNTNPEFEANEWQSINLSIIENINNLTFLAQSGDCNIVRNNAYNRSAYNITGTRQGNNFILSGAFGDCISGWLFFDGKLNYSEQITNYTFFSFKQGKPSVINLILEPNASTIPSVATTQTRLVGKATFNLSDTDTGNITFRWYAANVNVFNQTVTGLTNQSVANSTLNTGNFSQGQFVYFDAFAVANTITSPIVNSTNVTISAPTLPSTSLSSSAGNSFYLGTTTTISCTVTDDDMSSMNIIADGSNLCTGVSSCSGSYKPSSVGSKSITCSGTDTLSNSGSSSITLSVNQVPSSTPAASTSTSTTTTNPESTTTTESQTQNQNTQTESETQTTLESTTQPITESTTTENEIVIQQQVLREADQPTQQLVEGLVEVPLSNPEPINVVASTPQFTEPNVISGAAVYVENSKNEKVDINLKILQDGGLEKPRLDSQLDIKELKKIPQKINLRTTNNIKFSVVFIVFVAIIVTFIVNMNNLILIKNSKNKKFRYSQPKK